MPTPYINREQLEALYGAGFVTRAEVDTDANIAAILEAVNAEADAYVGCQVALPPVPAAIDQVRAAVARMAACMMYGQAAPEALVRADAAARKFLDNVAAGKVLLAKPEVLDDPTTPEVESDTGAACGAAPRRTGRLGY